MTLLGQRPYQGVDVIHRLRPHPIVSPDDLSIAGVSTARIKTGTYTGNDATSQGITGVGFKPKYLRVWQRATVNNTAIEVFETIDQIMDDHADGGASHLVMAWGQSQRFEINRLISLDTDGFTVDDNGANEHPNQNGVVYNYLAMG